jgi:plasmid maintenance system antidote protein VapI
MRLRNNIFAAAFDYLKRNHGIKTQKRLAELMGVSEDTITRILKDRTEVTEDIITKLQSASGCIFNLQWLRGEDSIHMLASDVNKEKNDESRQPIDQSSLVNAALAETIADIRERLKEKDELIADLREWLKEKDERLKEKDERLKEKDELIAALRRQLTNVGHSVMYKTIDDNPIPLAAENV